MRAFVFTDKALGRQAGRFVWLSINTEKRENAAVLAKYPIQASPTFFVLDPVAEKIVLKYVGGATVPQLQRILDDGARAAGHGARPKPDEWLAKADAFYSAGQNKEAAEAYRAALKGMAPSSPSYPRTVESLLFALSASRQHEACAAVAREAFPHLSDVAVRRERRGSGLDCALALDKKLPARPALVSEFTADAEQVLRGPRAGLAVDDVSVAVPDARRRSARTRATRPERRRSLEEWAAYLEGEAAKAKTAEGRAAFDAHRITAYLELGQPERGIAMLEASERDFPDDYNPPARLALAYRAMKKYDEALAASDRALQRAYGPRKLVILQARVRIYRKRGTLRRREGRCEEALAWAEALPKEQVSERQVAALKKQLEAPQ